MTIAAGFVYADGVILCADTEQTGWAMTLHGSKLDYFGYGMCKIGFAYAGNSEFAIAAIQRCRRQLEGSMLSPEASLVQIEKFVDREYRRTVLSHPDHATDSSLQYRLLVCISSVVSGSKLYVTNQTAIRQVDGYECIGIGEYLAHYLFRPGFSRDMTETQALAKATYMLGGVKGYVPGCGGVSEFLAIRNNGSLERFASVNPAPSNYLEWIEEYATGYDIISRELLFSMVDPNISDREFELRLTDFNNTIRNSRDNWRISRKLLTVANSPDPESTTADESPQPPSPELPVGSDES